MHAVLDGIDIPHVVNEDRVAQLADALDAAFALLQASRIPWQVEIDERGQSLEVESSDAASVPSTSLSWPLRTCCLTSSRGTGANRPSCQIPDLPEPA